jgi:biotin carboxyl carrier protein
MPLMQCPRCMRLSVRGAIEMRHLIELDGTLHHVWLGQSNGRYMLYLRDTTCIIALEPGKEGEATLVFGDERAPVVIAVDGARVFVQIEGTSHEMLLCDPISFHAMEAGSATEDAVCAPMPGSVIALPVAVGDAVCAGDTLLVIESMKLEMAVKAPRDGIVEAVNFRLGQSFERRAVLAVLSPQEG